MESSITYERKKMRRVVGRIEVVEVAQQALQRFADVGRFQHVITHSG